MVAPGVRYIVTLLFRWIEITKIFSWTEYDSAATGGGCGDDRLVDGRRVDSRAVANRSERLHVIVTRRGIGSSQRWDCKESDSCSDDSSAAEFEKCSSPSTFCGQRAVFSLEQAEPDHKF